MENNKPIIREKVFPHVHKEPYTKSEETTRGAAYARFLARIPRMISKTMELARPLAYASEVGESFRHIFPQLVKPLYALSIGYVLGDIAIKYHNVHNKNSEYRKWFLIDLSLWHIGASLVLPAVLINRYIHVTAKNLGKMNMPTKLVKYAPTVSALCLIPFVVHPLDHFTDWAMDNTFRQYYSYKDYDDIPLMPHQVIRTHEKLKNNQKL